MMDETRNEVLQESEFVKMLVRSRVIAEGQLKAVYDYQRSVGGSVLDILVKLNMMSRVDIERMLEAARRGEDVATVAEGKTIVAIDVRKLDVDGLQLHHRLIDKIPIEIIERCVLTVFFPIASVNSRKLVVGHGRDLPDGLVERISSTLGIELYTLALDEALAAGFVVEYLERTKKPVSDEMKSLCAEGRRNSEEQPAAQPEVAEKEPEVVEKEFVAVAVAEEKLEAVNEPPERQTGSGSDAGVPAAAHDTSSTGAMPGGSEDDTNDDDARDDLETDFDEDDRTSRDPIQVGGTQVMNRPSKVYESTELSIEWTALLNLLVKKHVLSHEEVRVEIELLKRNKSRF